jgi:hypothetical protein
VLQGDLDGASVGYDAAKSACSSSSSGTSGSDRLQQEVTADVIMGQAQVGQGQAKGSVFFVWNERGRSSSNRI